MAETVQTPLAGWTMGRKQGLKSWAPNLTHFLPRDGMEAKTVAHKELFVNHAIPLPVR